MSLIHPKAKEILDLAFSLDRATTIDDILLRLARKITEFLGGERIRIFDFDAINNEVFTKVKIFDSLVELNFPVSESSVAGYTGLHRKNIFLKNVRDQEELKKYSGIHYDARWERKTGLRVKSILSIPLVNEQEVFIGIIQLVNLKNDKCPSQEGVDFLRQIGLIVGSALFHHDIRQRRGGKFDLLLEKDLIREQDLKKAAGIAKENSEDMIKGDMVSILLDQFNVSEKDMAASISRYYLTDFLPYDEKRIVPTELLQGLNTHYFFRNLVAPLGKIGDSICFLVDDPQQIEVISQLKKSVKAKKIKLFVGFRRDILKMIKQLQSSQDSENLYRLEQKNEEHIPGDKQDDYENIVDENAPLVIQVVNKLILEAYQKGVSDIHIEPSATGNNTVVRYRLDGVCFKHTEIHSGLTPALINRIKLLARLKLDDHRSPQSGKISLHHGDSLIELRVEVTPTVGGQEDVVLRILAKSGFLPLEKMGFSDYNLEELLKVISKPYGIFLTVGPTGSGKTTTLHAILGHLNTPQKKIWTVEDPVEITQPDLRQVQVNPNVKPEPYDFARAMRSFLRADPDVIMVGEIRDQATAKIAIEASLTGHLVLSTLHTNTAAETVTRLMEIGIDPMNLGDSLLGVLAQRLIRTLCENCKEEYQPSVEEVESLVLEYGIGNVEQFSPLKGRDAGLFRPVGCASCSETGYRGRTSIHELLVGSPEIKKLIRSQKNSEEIREQAVSMGMVTLKMDGIQKVLAGMTTLNDVKAVCVA